MALSSFDLSGCVDLIWKYTNDGYSQPKWSLYVSNRSKYDVPMNVNYLGSIEAGDGLWILANGGEYGEGCEVQTKPSIIKSQKTLFLGHTAGGFANSEAFAALIKDGEVVTWGQSAWGSQFLCV